MVSNGKEVGYRMDAQIKRTSALSNTSPADLVERFQNPELHDRWETVYRDTRLQRRFNDVLFERFLNLMRIPVGGRVLDAGCGVGDHTLRFARAGFRCVGIDLSNYTLEQARQRATAESLDLNAQFLRQDLAELTDLEEDFDAIHCRGVLMHMPDWESALTELCRLLKPGGRILIMENNSASLEFLLVRMIRQVRKSESTLAWTQDGVEFHLDDYDQAPVTRIAHIPVLIEKMRQHGLQPVARIAAEFWDLNRFLGKLMRNAAVVFNRTYAGLHLPARFAITNAVVGEKVHRQNKCAERFTVGGFART